MRLIVALWLHVCRICPTALELNVPSASGATVWGIRQQSSPEKGEKTLPKNPNSRTKMASGSDCGK